MHAAGFVLVGGASSRMGQNKARLPWNSRLLVEEVASAVSAAAGSVTLVGNPQAYTDLPFECIPDLRSHCGPLAGIEAALAAQRAECNLILGCDMPGVPASVLSRLLEACQQTSTLCAVAQDSAGRLHPLCAVYHRACLPTVRASLDARRLRLLGLLAELQAVAVPVDSLVSNVNTPEQWAAFQAAHFI